MRSSHDLPKVRRQYETYPYPERNPDDEKRRLLTTGFDNLGMINHYGFRGRQDFRNGFRVLVAGGGTGDATLYLAEQLRETNAAIVYLDLSSASMNIARKRASIRGLANIEWIKGSLLDLPGMNLEAFDYISCTGVLHHLADPAQGLNALNAVLQEHGVLGLMVYATYGRTGIYQIQQLMRLIDTGEEDMQKAIENTKAALRSLPASNWFQLTESRFPGWKQSDIELFDLFLHSQDRSFTVPEVYDWIESCGLHLVDFCTAKLLYRPEYAFQDAALLDRIRRLSLRRQQAIAELAFGYISQHSFFAACQPDTVARPDDPENVPSIAEDIDGKALAEAFRGRAPGALVNLNIRYATITIKNGIVTKDLLERLDGQTCIGDVVEEVRKDKECEGKRITTESIMKEFLQIYETLHLMECLYLRHQSVPAFKTANELQEPVTRKHQRT